jgi:hypothetical protein
LRANGTATGDHMTTSTEDLRCDFEIFWGEIVPSEHLVQFYEDDTVFLDSLEEFVAGGIRAGDGVLVIATPAHRRALSDRLRARGLDPDSAESPYIALDVEETLARFMVNGWPDDRRFKGVVSELIGRARRDGRRVRAFGEMVAVLWALGHNGATVRLEHLWHRYCHEESFSLFCAYPRSGFTGDANSSMRDICAAHSRVIGDRPQPAIL